MQVELSAAEVSLIVNILDGTIEPIGSEFDDELEDLYTRLCQQYLVPSK